MNDERTKRRGEADEKLFTMVLKQMLAGFLKVKGFSNVDELTPDELMAPVFNENVDMIRGFALYMVGEICVMIKDPLRNGVVVAAHDVDTLGEDGQRDQEGLLQ